MAGSNHFKIESIIPLNASSTRLSKSTSLVSVSRSLPSLRVTCTFVQKSLASFTRLHAVATLSTGVLQSRTRLLCSVASPRRMSSSRRGCHMPPDQGGGDLLPNGLTRTPRPSHQLPSMEQSFLMPPREPNGGPGLGAPIPPLRRPNDRETRQSQYQPQCSMEFFNMEQNFGNSYNPQMELNEGLYESTPAVRGPGHLGRGLEPVNGHPTHELSNRTIPSQLGHPEMMFGNFQPGFMPQTGGMESGIKTTAKTPFMMNPNAILQRQHQQFGGGRMPPGMYHHSSRSHLGHQMINDYPPMEANLPKLFDLQMPNGVRQTPQPPHQTRQQRGRSMNNTFMQNSQQMSYEQQPQQQQQHSPLNDRRMQTNSHQNPQRVSSLLEYQAAQLAKQKIQNQPDRTRPIPASITNRKITPHHSAPQYYRTQGRGVNFGHQTNPAGLRMHRSSPQQRTGLRESKSNIKGLLHKIMNAIKFCEEAYSRSRNSRFEEFRQQFAYYGRYFTNFERKLQWSEEEEVELRQRVRQTCGLLDSLRRIKEQMDSPLSNTTVVHSQFMEPEGMSGYLNQDLAGPLEPPQANPEEQRVGMRPLERTKGGGEVDLAPAESSNRHQGLTKERPGDDVIDLYHTDESEKPQKPQKESLRAETRSRIIPGRAGGDRIPQIPLKHQQQGTGLSPRNEDLKILSKNKAPVSQQEANSGKKRGSGQQPSVQNERGSRRRVDQTNLAQSMMTGPWEEPPGALTGATPEPKEAEEDRGSTDGIKEVKKVVENNEGDRQDLEKLLEQLQNKEQDLPWQIAGLEFDSAVNPEEWRFERGILSSICSSIPVQESTVSSTNKIFRPEVANGVEGPVQITKDEHRTSEIEEEEEEPLDLIGRVQTECKELLESLEHHNKSGTFTYQTSVLDPLAQWKEIRNEKQAAFVLDCKRPSKVCCEIRLLIDAAYPDTVPDISFSTSSRTSPWFNSWFLSQIEELGLTSVAEILQFWTELDISMYPSS